MTRRTFLRQAGVGLAGTTVALTAIAQKGDHMTKSGANKPAAAGKPLTEDVKRTIVMAAATLAGGAMSNMSTAEWSAQMPGVVNAAFDLLVQQYRRLP